METNEQKSFNPTCMDSVPGVSLVHRKKIVVLQCRHVLRMNQNNYARHQHQHHYYHRSVHRHFDRKKICAYRARKIRRATQGMPFDHIFTSRENRRFEEESSKLSSARSGKFECRNRVPAVNPRILFKPKRTRLYVDETRLHIIYESVNSLRFAHFSRAF